jgi:hypothetical protein
MGPSASRRAQLHGLLVATLLTMLTACGGGGGSSSPAPPVKPPAATFTAKSGVAQKGPLIKGSTVTAQELDSTLSPTGKQYSYQTISDLGTFSPTSTFSSQYIGVNATGYYFDEVANALSTGPITLNGYSDLATDTVLNVNLLTTLEYQRIQNLIAKSNMSFAAARTQAEHEVLTALNIPIGSYGAFSTLDLSGTSDGDHILAAISSIFVYGNSAGPLIQLIDDFQSDIGANGVITNTKTTAALVAAAAAINPAAIASNLTQEYASEGLTFTASNISDWIAQSSDGVIGKFIFVVPDVTPSSVFSFPSFVVSQFAGTPVSVTAGNLSVNGNPASGTVSFNAGDSVTLSPGVSTLPNGGLNCYLVSGSKNLAKVSFYGTNGWAPTGSMAVGRVNHTATLLPNGTVLVAGGLPFSANPTGHSAWAEAEIYNPATGSWAVTGTMTVARQSHTATLLPNGTVLVAGGVDNNSVTLASAEIYNPATRTWTVTGSMATARSFPTATLLPSGTVLVAGGGNNSGYVASAEIYNPATGTWTATGSMAQARDGHAATLLPNGTVLATGGVPTSGLATNDAEIYSPANGTWTVTGAMTTARAYATATLLPNGTVLVAAGFNGAALSSAEIYDPASGVWTLTGSLISARADGFTATLLPNGTVLLAGCVPGCGSEIGSAEIYDPSAGTWAATGNMVDPQSGHTATLLPNGTVLAAGGAGLGTTAFSTSAEIYY